MNFALKSAIGTAALEELQEHVAGDASAEGGDTGQVQKTNEDAPDATTAAEGGAAVPATPAETGGEANAATPPAEGGDPSEANSDTAADVPTGDPVDEGAAGAGGEPTGGQEADAADASATAQAADEVASEEPPVGEDVAGGEAEMEISEEITAADANAQSAEDAAEDLAKLEAATESLSQTVDILHASMQRGGLDTYGAMFMRKNVREALESIDLTANAILLPALEDAETPSSRIGMAGDAIEAIKKFLARISAAVKDGIKKFWGWLTSTLTNLFSATERLKSRAEKLQGMLEGAEMAKEVTSRGVLTAFAINGRVKKDPAAYLDQMFDSIKHLADASLYDGYLKALEEMKKGVEGNEDVAVVETNVNAILKKLHDDVRNRGVKYTILLGEANPVGGTSHALTMQYPNSRVMAVFVPASIDSIGAMTNREVTAAADKLTQNSMPALTTEQAKTALKNVIELCDWLKASQKNTKTSVENFSKEVSKHSEMIMKSVETSLNKDMEQNVSSDKLRKILVWANRMAYSMPTIPCYKVTRIAPSAMAAALDLVAASIAKPASAAPGTAVATTK